METATREQELVSAGETKAVATTGMDSLGARHLWAAGAAMVNPVAAVVAVAVAGAEGTARTAAAAVATAATAVGLAEAAGAGAPTAAGVVDVALVVAAAAAAAVAVAEEATSVPAAFEHFATAVGAPPVGHATASQKVHGFRQVVGSVAAS